MAMQPALVGLFHTESPHIVRAGVLHFIKPGQVAVTDTSYRANRVSNKVGIGILTQQLRLDLHPRQPVLLNGNARLFFLGQARAQRNRLIGTTRAHEPLAKRCNFVCGQANQFVQRCQRRL